MYIKYGGYLILFYTYRNTLLLYLRVNVYYIGCLFNSIKSMSSQRHKTQCNFCFYINCKLVDINLNPSVYCFVCIRAKT